MAKTEDLAARVDRLESIVLKLAELIRPINRHAAAELGDALKPVLERRREKAPA